METVQSIFGLFLSATILENVIFTRPMGISESITNKKYDREMPIFALAVLILTTLSSLVGSGLRYMTDTLLPDLPEYGQEAILFLAVIISYAVMWGVLKYKFATYLPRFNSLLARAALSGAVYGCLLMAGATDLDALSSVVYGLGTGCGMVVAVWLLGVARRRFSYIDLPRAFKGMPIMLLYLGILSLVIYGLLGHNQPT